MAGPAGAARYILHAVGFRALISRSKEKIRIGRASLRGKLHSLPARNVVKFETALRAAPTLGENNKDGDGKEKVCAFAPLSRHRRLTHTALESVMVRTHSRRIRVFSILR